jgi:hypothetical protein
VKVINIYLQFVHHISLNSFRILDDVPDLETLGGIAESLLCAEGETVLSKACKVYHFRPCGLHGMSCAWSPCICDNGMACDLFILSPVVLFLPL